MKLSGFHQYRGPGTSNCCTGPLSLSKSVLFNRARSDVDEISDHPTDYAFAFIPAVFEGHSLSNRSFLSVTLSSMIAIGSPSCRRALLVGQLSFNTRFSSFRDSVAFALESRVALPSTVLSYFLLLISSDLPFRNHKSPNP